MPRPGSWDVREMQMGPRLYFFAANSLQVEIFRYFLTLVLDQKYTIIIILARLTGLIKLNHVLVVNSSRQIKTSLALAIFRHFSIKVPRNLSQIVQKLR